MHLHKAAEVQGGGARGDHCRHLSSNRLATACCQPAAAAHTLQNLRVHRSTGQTQVPLVRTSGPVPALPVPPGRKRCNADQLKRVAVGCSSHSAPCTHPGSLTALVPPTHAPHAEVVRAEEGIRLRQVLGWGRGLQGHLQPRPCPSRGEHSSLRPPPPLELQYTPLSPRPTWLGWFWLPCPEGPPSGAPSS